ncbi:hypothetical protein, partial [Klebsiella pneumoniae]|uniref:hypothetical protein n=1 Tax=Klebsiella pneumoniae TaxID=573 RepID=UPI001954CED8
PAPLARPDLPNPVMAETAEMLLPMTAAPSIAADFGPAPFQPAPASAFRGDEVAPAWQQPGGLRAPIDPNLPPDFP